MNCLKIRFCILFCICLFATLIFSSLSFAKIDPKDNISALLTESLNETNDTTTNNCGSN